jgi:hypothetical protein
MNGKNSHPTAFVQVAEMELLGGADFDLVLIAATQLSYEAHFASLSEQMGYHGAKPVVVILEEDFSEQGQWSWFEKILRHIEPHDRLTVDMTHGYRSTSIILSAAINFLQRARNVILDGVYYGAFEKDKELSPIVDMKAFYDINLWADAVGRLVDDADARKLAEVAEQGHGVQVKELKDEALIDIFGKLTNVIRNVDVNNVAPVARNAMNILSKKRPTASITGKILLDLVIDKFVILSASAGPIGVYSKDYFDIQLAIVRLLLDHKLFMQAYTVMREFVASMGMVGVEGVKLGSSKGRKKRKRYGDVFVNMIQFERNEWHFNEKQDAADNLKPFLDQLQTIGVESILRGFFKDLVDYRNGFDHAWTCKSAAPDDVADKGIRFLADLERAVTIMDAKGFFPYCRPANTNQTKVLAGDREAE